MRLQIASMPVSGPTPEDDDGVLLHQFMGVCDEHQGRETSKHVRRTMKENARQRCWNGAPAPYGFRAFVAEVRGKKLENKLEHDPVEAPIVPAMFDLAECGEGRSGPMGMKAIVNWLHEHGYRTRRGNARHVRTVRAVLTGSAAKGQF